MTLFCGYVAAATIVALVLVEVFGRVLNRVGMKIAFAEIGEHIERMMRAGTNGAKLLLLVPRRRIEFLKLAPRGGPTRFLLVVSRRHCSPEEFAEVRQRLKEQGIPFHLSSRDGRAAQERLVVECERDVSLAIRAAHAVLVGAFGAGPGTPLRAGFVGGLDLREGAVIGWGYPERPENVGIVDYHRPERRQEEARVSDGTCRTGEQDQDRSD